MRRGRRDSELRVTGLGLRARFVLSMTVALLLVMAATTYLIYVTSTRITRNAMTNAMADAVKLSRDIPPHELSPGRFVTANGTEVRRYVAKDGSEGFRYRYGDSEDPLGVAQLYVPDGETGEESVLRMLIALMTLVVIVGAVVAAWVASQVSRPVRELIDDVRAISKGNLRHKTSAVGAGEIELLARSIDRMTSDLEDARDAELELSMRKREREVAGGVREALLPLMTPLVERFDIGAAFVGGPDFGGDFHDFIERPDGRVGLLVCGVSGSGIPAALIGATARSYLRGELERTDDVVGAFQKVNRWLFQDMRRGMFVTALYALVDPRIGTALIACAGHRVPLLRYDAEGAQMRIVHPEGIALGFDKGPVFNRRIQVVETPIEPGDRFVLTNSAPVELKNEEGRELGEKAFYSRVLKHATLDTQQFLKAMRRDLDSYVGESGIDRDISIVTISREA